MSASAGALVCLCEAPAGVREDRSTGRRARETRTVLRQARPSDVRAIAELVRPY